MCDLADRDIQTSKQELASALIDQLTAAYAKLGSDDQHFLAQRLLNLSMRTQQNPGSGVRSQLLVTTVLLALNKGHWIDADGTLSGTLSNVANQYMARQHLLQAEPVMKAALCLIETNPANRFYTQMHLNMGSLYERLTRYTEAEKEYRLALAGADTNQSVAYSQRRQALTQLCNLYLRLNSKGKIQTLLPDMISAAKEMQFQERYVFDQCLTQLVAHNYSAEAEQIIDAEIDSISQDLPQTARNNSTELLKSSVRKWSEDFVKEGNDGAAVRIYEHWLQVIEQVYGATSFETADAYLNAAKFMIEHDRFDRAHELIQKSLPIGSKLHDETFVKALAECGMALQHKHRSEEAERLLVEALEMSNAATRLNIQLSLGAMYSQQGSEQKAAALTTAIMGEVKEQFSTGDRDINAAIEEVVENNLKHSDFSDAQLFIDLISSRKSRAYVVRNGLNLQQMDQTQTLDAIMQTYERRGDYAAAAKTCKLEIDKFADTLDARTLRNLYKRYSNLLRLSGDQESAQVYDTRANNVTDRPLRTPN
jgi:tetratricopeptide (TPR) repeat protein